MARPLEGSVAVVTGASAGIGRSIAAHLAEAGAHVLACGRRENLLLELEKHSNSAGTSATARGSTGSIKAFVLDVCGRGECQKAADFAAEAFGKPVDIWINNAGVMMLGPMEACLEAEWEQMIDVNVKGVLHGIAAVLPGMLERKTGDIVNISSDAGRKVFSNGGVYCATKWAVEAITQSLRIEHAGSGLRFLSVQPGATKTELASHTTHPATKEGMAKAEAAGLVSFLEADDVARSVVFALCQPRNCSINEIMLRPQGQGQ